MIYLDNAATKPLSQDMKQFVASILDIYGNPSSLHSVGEKARQLVTNARRQTAAFINADTEEIYFTCGGSAGNTLGIKGFLTANDYCTCYSPTVHKSILNLLQSTSLAGSRHPLKVDREGMLDLKDLEQSIAGTKPFVVVDYANSEIGTIQNMRQIVDLVHFHKGIVYADCTGSIPAVPLDVKSLDLDLCAFSGHKLGSLKGCGVFYKKKDVQIEPLIYGTQEQSLFGGTENVVGIASLGKAVQDYDYASVSSADRDHLYEYIQKNIPDSYLVGACPESGRRLPNNLYMCFKGIEGEALMMMMDMNGVQTSTGSACSSHALSASTTLSAIGMDEADIHSCIRFSFGECLSENKRNYVCKTLKKCVETLRSLPAQPKILEQPFQTI